MKKLSINLIICLILSGILIVLAMIFVKPNRYYTILKKDSSTLEALVSLDNKTFRYENDVIKYSKKDNKLTIDINLEGVDDGRMVYFYKGDEKGRLVMSLEGKIFEAKYFENEYNLEGLTVEEMNLYFKYITLLTVTHDDVATQKGVCVVLSIIIAFILSLLAYPAFLFDSFKETKELAITAISMTILLCICSAFYIYFTLK